MQALVDELGATAVQMNATDEAEVAALFDTLPSSPRVLVYNPSARVRGPVAEL